MSNSLMFITKSDACAYVYDAMLQNTMYNLDTVKIIHGEPNLIAVYVKCMNCVAKWESAIGPVARLYVEAKRSENALLRMRDYEYAVDYANAIAEDAGGDDKSDVYYEYFKRRANIAFKQREYDRAVQEYVDAHLSEALADLYDTNGYREVIYALVGIYIRRNWFPDEANNQDGSGILNMQE